MLHFLPAPVKGVVSLLLYVLNTVFWCILLFTGAILKFLIPIPVWRKFCDILLIRIASAWVLCNSLNLKLLHRIQWEVQGLEKLDMDEWYLVVANHQSWVDILVLQHIFHGKIPFLKFFLKKELIWVPILGIAWWALDFPFMKRYSPEFLKKKPHLKGQDLEITKKACQKFKITPISVMNFLEGTRLTAEKHNRQQSPFLHLLKPKAGGIAFVLAAMEDCLKRILDVSIVYPEGPPHFWDFLSGRIHKIRVHVRLIPVTPAISGNYFENEAYRDSFQEWINDLWGAKDDLVRRMKSSEAPAWFVPEDEGKAPAGDIAN